MTGARPAGAEPGDGGVEYVFRTPGAKIDRPVVSEVRVKVTVRIELARALNRPIPPERPEVLRTTHQNWPVERLDQQPGATP